MDDLVPQSDPQNIEPAAPLPVEPAAEPVKETEGSLAEHAAQVAKDTGRDDVGRFKRPRGKQQASPDDVPVIAELTKRLRTAEDAIGLKIEQKPGESDRVFQLRRRAEYAEAIAKPKAAPEPPKNLAPKLKPVPVVEPGTFDEKEPTLEQFADKDDPYAAYLRATAAFDRRKEAFEASEAAKQQSVESVSKENHSELQKFFGERQADFGGRLKALIEAQPEALAIFEASKQTPLTDVMHAALLLDPRGEQVMLDVFKNRQHLQDQLDDLFLSTDGKPVTPAFVAMVQRRFHSMTQAVSTGAAPSVVRQPAPRPPTPVRTAPARPADAPPKDEDSLAAHAAFYGKKR